MRIVLILTIALQFSLPDASAQFLKSTPVDGFSYDFGRWPYPLNEEVGARLKELAQQYPDIAQIRTIGKSRRGKDLWVLEITNIRTGPGKSKPGLWLDRNIHARELTGRAYLQYFAERMLYSYGEDEKVSNIIDTRTFYVMPVFDADGGDILLSRHPAWRRAINRPIMLEKTLTGMVILPKFACRTIPGRAGTAITSRVPKPCRYHSPLRHI